MVWVGKVFLTCLFLHVKQIKTTKMCTNQKKAHLEMLCTVTHCTGHILAIVENVHDKPGCMLIDSQLVSWLSQ